MNSFSFWYICLLFHLSAPVDTVLQHGGRYCPSENPSCLLQFHIHNSLQRVAPLFSNACNILCCLWLRSRIENERVVGLLLAQNRKQTQLHPRSLREHDIVIFMTPLSVSLLDKHKKYELHSQRFWASISSDEMAVWGNRDMIEKKKSWWSELLNWLWNENPNKRVSSSSCVLSRSGQHI